MNRMRGGRWSLLQEEIKKCALLCANCHKLFHNSSQPKDHGRMLLKQKLLEYKGVFACQKCGHSDSRNVTLGFHHRIAVDKRGEINEITWAGRNRHAELDEFVKNELDKCDVLCRNCHLKLHRNVEWFTRFEDAIRKKMESHKELKRIDREEILRLYSSGLRQVDIVKKLGCAKSMVSIVVNGAQKQES